MNEVNGRRYGARPKAKQKNKVSDSVYVKCSGQKICNVLRIK